MLPVQTIVFSLSVPHFFMPFVFPAHLNILINGWPALMIGSMCIPHPCPEDPLCSIPIPDVTLFGMPNITFNGIPAIPMKALALHTTGKIGAGGIGALVRESLSLCSPSLCMFGMPNVLLG